MQTAQRDGLAARRRASRATRPRVPMPAATTRKGWTAGPELADALWRHVDERTDAILSDLTRCGILREPNWELDWLRAQRPLLPDGLDWGILACMSMDDPENPLFRALQALGLLELVGRYAEWIKKQHEPFRRRRDRPGLFAAVAAARAERPRPKWATVFGRVKRELPDELTGLADADSLKVWWHAERRARAANGSA